MRFAAAHGDGFKMIQKIRPVPCADSADVIARGLGGVFHVLPKASLSPSGHVDPPSVQTSLFGIHQMRNGVKKPTASGFACVPST